MLIRKACESDIQALLDIYNYEVENGVATLDIQPKSMEQWTHWYNAHNVNNHPLIVAQKEDSIAGYASLSPYREKEAYKSTVELSVYVHNEYRQQGVATLLMDNILKLAAEDERTHMVVSVITSGNEASCKLHQKFGFEFCGTIKEVGEKFGRLLDIDNYQLILRK